MDSPFVETPFITTEVIIVFFLIVPTAHEHSKNVLDDDCERDCIPCMWYRANQRHTGNTAVRWGAHERAPPHGSSE